MACAVPAIPWVQSLKKARFMLAFFVLPHIKERPWFETYLRILKEPLNGSPQICVLESRFFKEFCYLYHNLIYFYQPKSGNC
jgi:hypothetical protein